jgi:hypothetical protein
MCIKEKERLTYLWQTVTQKDIFIQLIIINAIPLIHTQTSKFLNPFTFSYKFNLIKKTGRQAHYFRNNCAIVFVYISILMTIRILQ